MGADRRVPMCSGGRASRRRYGAPRRPVAAGRRPIGSAGGGAIRGGSVCPPALLGPRLRTIAGRGASPLKIGARSPYMHPLQEGSDLLGCIASAPEASATVRHRQEILRAKGARRSASRAAAREPGRPGRDERIPRRPRLGYRVRRVYRPGRFINGLGALPLNGAA